MPESEIGGTTLGLTTVVATRKVHMTGHYVINDDILVTGEHFFFINRSGIWQFMNVWSILEGDIMLNNELKEVPVRSITTVSGITNVIQLTVGPNDLFFGSNILTHNTKVNPGEPPPAPTTTATF